MARVCDNGIYRDATPEELAEMTQSQERWEQEQSQLPPSPTPEQRLDAVEAETKSVRSDVDALSIIITGKEVNHHGNQ